MLSILNTSVVQGRHTKKCCVYCGRLWRSEEETKSAFQEVGYLFALWFNQAEQSYVAVSDTLLTEKTVHLATRWGIEDLEASNGWIDSFK